MNFWRTKTFKKRGGPFQSEKFHCKFGAGATGLRKKLQYIFQKNGQGGKGVKGCSEIFRKFIRFGERRLPLHIVFKDNDWVLKFKAPYNLL